MREEILRRLNVLSQQMPPENRQELLEIAEDMLAYVQNAGDQAFFAGDFEKAIIDVYPSGRGNPLAFSGGRNAPA